MFPCSNLLFNYCLVVVVSCVLELSDYRAVGLAIGSRVKDNNPLGPPKVHVTGFR